VIPLGHGFVLAHVYDISTSVNLVHEGAMMAEGADTFRRHPGAKILLRYLDTANVTVR